MLTAGVRADVQKVQHAVALLDPPHLTQREHPRDEPVLGMQHQLVERGGRARRAPRSVGGSRQLKERVNLSALGPAQRVLDHATSRMNVARAGEICGWGAVARDEGIERAQVSPPERRAAICNPTLLVEQSVEGDAKAYLGHSLERVQHIDL